MTELTEKIGTCPFGREGCNGIPPIYRRDLKNIRTRIDLGVNCPNYLECYDLSLEGKRFSYKSLPESDVQRIEKQWANAEQKITFGFPKILKEI